uniref:UBA domain-containing protein n=1 Tax=Arundo donax TaxID=35708 RepID=A0A0A9DYC1_ARUDO
MPSASKSKSKDRSAAKVAKEQPKIAAKPVGNGTLASTYNNLSGKFHVLEPSASLLGSQGNDRFMNTDEIDEHSRSSHGTGEFDCASNNGSCSGESEDPKEKTTSTAPRVDSVPGCDVDKREKIRQKNEKKHQRQKERRAQELHERCKGYLMSRKLEALAQKLVAMGFSSDQAMMALIQNEGCVEESVTWLCNFDGSEETKQQLAAAQQSRVNLKIDIAEELAKTVSLEAKYKCTKQEVERAVVSCEGDLEKAEDVLKAHKQESTAVPSKPEGSGDSSGLANKQQVMLAHNPARPQTNGFSSVGAQQMRREKDLNYKLLINGSGPKEPAIKGFQPLAAPIKPEMGRQQFVPPEKRRLNASLVPSVPYVASSPLPVAVPQLKSDMRHVAGGNEVKSVMPNGTLRESVIVMQCPQSAVTKQSLPSTSHSMFASEPSSREWYLNGASNVDMMLSGGLGHGLRNMSLDSVNSAKPFGHATHQQSFVSNPIELAANGWGGTWGSGGASSSRAVVSSFGSFRGWSSSESSSTLSHSDWRTNGLAPYDYTSVDWSVDTTLLNPAAKSEWLSDTWSTMFMGGKSSRAPGNLGGAGISGLHDSNHPMDPAPSPRSYEWSSFCRGGSS